MLLVKSKPALHVNDGIFPRHFQSAFNSLFDENFPTTESFGFQPLSDLIENEGDYEIRMALPGIKKEDIKLSLEGYFLTVEGERKEDVKEEKSKYLKREIRFGKFSRSFKIAQMDANAIEAKFEDGYLVIKLPKKAEAKVKMIDIK